MTPDIATEYAKLKEMAKAAGRFVDTWRRRACECCGARAWKLAGEGHISLGATAPVLGYAMVCDDCGNLRFIASRALRYWYEQHFPAAQP